MTCSLLLISSCSDEFFELTPQDRVSDKTVWSDPAVADLFLTNIYSYLPPMQIGYRKSEDWTDNCINIQVWQEEPERFRSGAMSASNPLGSPPLDYSVTEWGWETTYSYIRECNVFIEKVRQSTILSDEYKRKRIPEARFMRAWFYKNLLKYYGGVPILTKPLNRDTQGAEIFKERASLQETVQFIVDDCQAAADSLPVVQAEWGRITKGAALALKGHVELLAASPLNNPENNKALWSQAAATYKQIMDLGVYRLMDYYHGLWLEENNKNSEVILPLTHKYPRSGPNVDRTLADCYGPAYITAIPHGVINYSIVTAVPTQDLVDTYRMKDGKSITESPLYDPDHPYENREPRFYESIIYDGAPYRDGYIYTRRGDPWNAVDRSRAKWVTATGYYMFKVYDERGNGLLEGANGKISYIDWPIIRYAEVLLSYAEAQNEAVGPDASVLDAINQIRTRKDIAIPTIQETYGTVSQEQMREIIRTERRIELAFEDKRWPDIARWKLGHKLQGYVRGVEPIADPGTGKITYDYFNVTQQFFTEKNYRFPIPLPLMEKNTKLVQNPGY